jgi:Domain of unknown function (DUF4760)
MRISWEALSALASAISSIAVLAAVIVAARQVRVGTQQVEHLRKATQLEGTMKLFEMLASPEQHDARRFVSMALAAKLKDPVYRAELGLMTMAPQPHPEMTVLRLMEMVGTYVKHGLLDEEIIYDYWIPAIVNTWEPLQRLGVIRAHRESGGTKMWENFEALYERAQAWLSTADPYDFRPMSQVR